MFGSFTHALCLLLTSPALLNYFFAVVDRDSSVGIATHYGLDGPGIESRWGRDFPHPPRSALGPTQPPIHCVPGLYRGQNGRGVALTIQPHLAPMLKKEYSYTSISPLGLRGLLQGEPYLYHYLYLHCRMGQVWVFLFSFSSYQHMLALHLDLTIGALSISVTLHR